ncbi:hypothetical protein NOCARDAX2BIS_400185 [Nocardioides sp. AX2bis]|nr:hypothetical protein NOCARDAX2BIS_400185 [Nocardioides sp. AX2bis]
MACGVRDDRQPGLDLHQPAAPARDLLLRLIDEHLRPRPPLGRRVTRGPRI